MADADRNELAEDSEKTSKTVRVPVRRTANPFGGAEYAEVPEECAAHWSDRVWHDRPSR